MNKDKILKIINYGWPFVVLMILIWFGYLYILPLLPQDKEVNKKIGFKPRYEMVKNQNDLQSLQSDKGIKEEYGNSDIENREVIIIDQESDIEEVLSTIKDGDTLVFGGGIYNLNIQTNKKIDIIGQGTSTVLVEKSDERPVINIQNSISSISNLIISNSRIGVEVENSNLSIKNVKFLGLSASAIYGLDSEVEVDGSYIYSSGSAIKMKNSKGKIENSIIKNNMKSGVQLINSDFEITNNSITGNESYGIFVDNDSSAEIKNNFIKNNIGYNVRFENLKRIYE